MTDQNLPQPPGGAWTPAHQPVAGQAPPPPPPTGAVPPPPPTQQSWAPAPQQSWAPPPPPPGAPPAGTFNPTQVGGSGRAYYRRRGFRGNGIYSMVVGIISILVPLVSLLVLRNGTFTFLIILPVAGLVYGIMSVVQRNRRGFGIAGIVLCSVALLLELLLAVG